MHMLVLCAAEVGMIAEMRADMVKAGSAQDFVEAQRYPRVLHCLARELRHV